MFSTMRPVVRTSPPAYTVSCNLVAKTRDPLCKESRGSRKTPERMYRIRYISLLSDPVHKASACGILQISRDYAQKRAFVLYSVD